MVRLNYCTASAHQVSPGLVRLEPQLLADAGCETPAINYRRFNGRKYRCDLFASRTFICKRVLKLEEVCDYDRHSAFRLV